MKKIIVDAEELNMIEAFRAAKETKGSTSATVNSGDSALGNEGIRSTKQREPMQNVLMQAMKKHRALPLALRSQQTIIACLADAAEKQLSKIGSVSAFWAYLQDQARIVRERTFDFATVCGERGLIGYEQAIAENLVFAGKAVCNKVRMDGLASYEGDLSQLTERLVPEQYRDGQAVVEHTATVVNG